MHVFSKKCFGLVLRCSEVDVGSSECRMNLDPRVFPSVLLVVRCDFSDFFCKRTPISLLRWMNPLKDIVKFPKYKFCCFLLNSYVIPVVRFGHPPSSIMNRSVRRLGTEFVEGMMKADNRHRQRFPRTIACGYDGGKVLRPPSRTIALCAGFPPTNLAWVSLNAEPARSKELDVSAAESQIVCNRSLCEVNWQPSYLSPTLLRCGNKELYLRI